MSKIKVDYPGAVIIEPACEECESTSEVENYNADDQRMIAGLPDLWLCVNCAEAVINAAVVDANYEAFVADAEPTFHE